MNVAELTPLPGHKQLFSRDRVKFVTSTSGCYALTTFEGSVLYVGLATNLQRRIVQHLDTPEKVAPTPLGRAVWFWWYETPEINKVERTWMNIHIQHEGVIPTLNRIYSATPT
jgi:hypothetical protein